MFDINLAEIEKEKLAQHTERVVLEAKVQLDTVRTNLNQDTDRSGNSGEPQKESQENLDSPK